MSEWDDLRVEFLSIAKRNAMEEAGSGWDLLGRRLRQSLIAYHLLQVISFRGPESPAYAETAKLARELSDEEL